MADALHGAASADHDEEIHLPPPTAWPFFAAFGGGGMLAGLLMLASESPIGPGFFAGSLAVTLVSALGWMMAVIRDKREMDPALGNRVLSLGWKLFLVSEAAIFAAFFGHYGYIVYGYDFANQPWPPAGTPHVHLIYPMIGTLILVTSSFTCELGHKALLRGNKTLCKNWIAFTIILGFVFLSIQGYEWGYLQARDGFRPDTNIIGTLFYLITGFHGAHVITGLLLLFLVYSRLEMGSFDRQRHFSMNAASWYWHFVDVIWVLVFFFLYIGIQYTE